MVFLENADNTDTAN